MLMLIPAKNEVARVTPKSKAMNSLNDLVTLLNAYVANPSGIVFKTGTLNLHGKD